MSWRLCTFNVRPCTCDDAAMQPCLAALVELYLEAIRFEVISGVEMRFELYTIRQQIEEIFQAFTTWEALKRNIERSG